MISSVVISSLSTIVVGVLLLFLEYRTGWFQRTATAMGQAQMLDVITTNRLEIGIKRAKWVFGTVIFVGPIVAVIVVLIVSAHISYLEAQLAAYAQSETWQLPETLSGLKEISGELQLTLDERQQLKSLAQQVSELGAAKGQAEQQVAELTSQNAQSMARVAELERVLIEPRTVEVKAGESVSIYGNSYYLGLTTVNGSYVSGYINNDSWLPSPGNRYSFESEGTHCIVTLKSVASATNSATFLVACEKK